MPLQKKNYIIGWQWEPMEERQHVNNCWAQEHEKKNDTPFFVSCFEPTTKHFWDGWLECKKPMVSQPETTQRDEGCQIVAGGFPKGIL